MAHRTDVEQRAADRGALTRVFNMTTFEFRGEDGGKVTFEGVASVVDTPYQVRDQWGTFTETIRSGAFNKTLRDGKADVALFINHDTRALPLATRLDGSLKLAADPHLRVLAELNPARPSVQEARHAVADGQARQMSIGFSVPEARDHWNDDYTVREISEVNLGETSIVWRGASPTTTGAIRSLDEFLESLTEIEMDEADLHRAIAHFTSLLPAPEEEHRNPSTEDLVALWALRQQPAYA
jgi:HK97 family phage prohead protease